MKSFYFAYLFLQNSQKRLAIMLLGCVKMAIVKNVKNKIKIPKKNLKIIKKLMGIEEKELLKF